MAQCRGMRMGYAPLLALLEPALQQGYKRLAVIGIPCQVYALRALEAELGFERLYVIGTPCSDNTTTERFHEFLELLARETDDAADDITYLEFRADYHVELRYRDGRKRAVPFLMLPLSQLPNDFFPADLPHLRRLHQRAGRHHGGLHGRRGRAVAAGAQ
jgi:coenzyme F420 hydrogenase subunit beta